MRSGYHSPGFLLAGGLILCGAAHAQTAPGALDGEAQRCGEFQASNYEILRTARSFPTADQSGKKEDGTVMAEVLALRCLTGEPDATGKLRDLLADATLAGRLYALVGLRVLDIVYFNQHIATYTCSEEKILASGGHVVVHLPVSGTAGAIGAGFYSETFLPAMPDPLELPGGVPTLYQPMVGASAEQIAAQRTALATIPDPRVRYDTRWIPRYVYFVSARYPVPRNLADEQNRPQLDALLRLIRALLLSEQTETFKLEKEWGDGPFRTIRFEQSIRGIPVEDGRLLVRVDNRTGHLHEIQARFLPDRGLPTAPRLSAPEAQRAALGFAENYVREKGFRRASIAPPDYSSIVIGPLTSSGEPRLSYRIGSEEAARQASLLVWNVSIEAGGIHLTNVAVDAMDGSLVATYGGIFH